MPTKEENELIRQAAELDPKFAKKIYGTDTEAGKKVADAAGQLGLIGVGKVKTRDIHLKVDTPAPGQCVISDAWVTLQGSSARVTSVPVGTNFDIYVSFSAVNNNGGQWTVCITVSSSDKSIQNYTLLGTSITGGNSLNWNAKKMDGEGSRPTNTMPDGTGDLNLTFKMWLIDGLNPSTLPASSNW